jgi:hypothetical protein
MEIEPGILKTDTIGRVFTPPARREQLLDEFEGSGLSGAKFAALAGIKYATFASWAHARRRRRGTDSASKAPSSPAASMRWLEAVVDRAQTSGSALRICLPGGAHLEISQTTQIPLAVALLAALEKPALAC